MLSPFGVKICQTVRIASDRIVEASTQWRNRRAPYEDRVRISSSRRGVHVSPSFSSTSKTFVAVSAIESECSTEGMAGMIGENRWSAREPGLELAQYLRHSSLWGEAGELEPQPFLTQR